MALAITLPIAWYLALPLLIRTELVEPLPAAVSESATPGPAVPSDDSMSSPEPSSVPVDTDPADYASAVVWCKQCAVLFAVAPLAAG